jgi:hypothetical protein
MACDTSLFPCFVCSVCSVCFDDLAETLAVKEVDNKQREKDEEMLRM